jgi:DNA modification methylase
MNTIIIGDALAELGKLPEQSVQCCVTSPPYWGLRNYGVPGQLGLEKTPEEYTAKLVDIFRAVKRVLRDDGVLWLNLGDSYHGSWGNSGSRPELDGKTLGQREKNTVYLAGGGRDSHRERPPTSRNLPGLKPKDLVGIPWRVAFALQADGWYLRSDIIWAKPNPMPESVTDRCTKAHEYIFMLTKKDRYYYDADAIANPLPQCSLDRYQHAVDSNEKYDSTRHKNNGNSQAPMAILTRAAAGVLKKGTANKRSVWTVATNSYRGAHFATFPPKLILPCVLAGSRPGDTVLDPFAGSGTVGAVAKQHGRAFIGCELKPEYLELAKARIAAAKAP